jgi:hypothetical protein
MHFQQRAWGPADVCLRANFLRVSSVLARYLDVLIEPPASFREAI